MYDRRIAARHQPNRRRLPWRRGLGRLAVSVLAAGVLVGCERAESVAGRSGTATPGTDGGKLNVLLISADTTRADYLACYGNPVIRTPNIDRLAAEGTRFAQCTASTPSTLPSHASIMTGSYPFVHGARDNASFRLESENQTLAEIMKQGGYATHAQVAAIVMDARHGLSQGFDTYGEVGSAPLAGTETGEPSEDDSADAKRLMSMTRIERQADQIARQGIELLRRNQGQPFFVFLHFFDPHLPYRAPKRFTEEFPDPYMAEIAFVDEQLGKVLAAIDELGLADKTLVVLLSDHGEGRGQHGERTHSFFLYDTTLRVPLVMRCPGRIPAGRVVESQVRLIDVMPTILAVVGLEGTAQIQGASLLPLIADPSKAPALPCYADTMTARETLGYSALRALRVDGWKYILSPKPELYHVAEDKLELYNLVHAEVDRARAMGERLRQLVAESPDPPATRGSRRVIEEADWQRFAALGYIHGDGYRGSDDPMAAATELEDFEPHGPDPRDNIHALELMAAAKGTLVSGDFKNAETHYRQLHEMVPDNVRVAKELADTLVCLERLDEAKELYQQALKRDPTFQAVYTALGAVLANQGNFVEAEENYRRALALDPNRAPTCAGYANLLAQMGRFDEAVENYAKAAELDPLAENVWFKWAMALLRSGQVSESVPKFRKAIEIDPDNAEVRASLAQALRELGRTDEGLAELSVLVERDPDSAPAQAYLGQWYFQQGDYAEAAKHLQRSAELDPQDPQAWMRLGSAEVRAGQAEQGIARFRKALELKPGLPEALLKLGAILETTGRPDEALAAFDRLIEAAPEEVDGHLAAVRILAGRGDHAACIDRLWRAHKQLPDNVLVANELAWLLATCPRAELRSGAQAVEVAERASSQAPEESRPALLDTLAAAYAEAGRFEDAIAAADKAIALATERGQSDFASRVAARRDMYARKEPYHKD